MHLTPTLSRFPLKFCNDGEAKLSILYKNVESGVLFTRRVRSCGNAPRERRFRKYFCKYSRKCFSVNVFEFWGNVMFAVGKQKLNHFMIHISYI